MDEYMEMEASAEQESSGSNTRQHSKNQTSINPKSPVEDQQLFFLEPNDMLYQQAERLSHLANLSMVEGHSLSPRHSQNINTRGKKLGQKIFSETSQIQDESSKSSKKINKKLSKINTKGTRSTPANSSNVATRNVEGDLMETSQDYLSNKILVEQSFNSVHQQSIMDKSKQVRSSKFTNYVHQQIVKEKDLIENDLSAQYYRLKKIKRQQTLLAMRNEQSIKNTLSKAQHASYQSLSPLAQKMESGSSKPIVPNVVIKSDDIPKPMVESTVSYRSASNEDEYFEEKTQDLLKKQSNFNKMQVFYQQQILQMSQKALPDISVGQYSQESLSTILKSGQESMAQLQDSEQLLAQEGQIAKMKHNMVNLSVQNPEYLRLISGLQKNNQKSFNQRLKNLEVHLGGVEMNMAQVQYMNNADDNFIKKLKQKSRYRGGAPSDLKISDRYASRKNSSKNIISENKSKSKIMKSQRESIQKLPFNLQQPSHSIEKFDKLINSCPSDDGSDFTFAQQNDLTPGFSGIFNQSQIFKYDQKLASEGDNLVAKKIKFQKAKRSSLMQSPTSKLAKLKEIQKAKNFKHHHLEIDKLQDMVDVQQKQRVTKTDTQKLSRNSVAIKSSKNLQSSPSKVDFQNVRGSIQEKHSRGYILSKQQKGIITNRSSIHARSPVPPPLINTDIAEVVNMLELKHRNSTKSSQKLQFVSESQSNITSQPLKEPRQNSSNSIRARSVKSSQKDQIGKNISEINAQEKILTETTYQNQTDTVNTYANQTCINSTVLNTNASVSNKQISQILSPQNANPVSVENLMRKVSHGSSGIIDVILQEDAMKINETNKSYSKMHSPRSPHFQMRSKLNENSIKLPQIHTTSSVLQKNIQNSGINSRNFKFTGSISDDKGVVVLQGKQLDSKNAEGSFGDQSTPLVSGILSDQKSPEDLKLQVNIKNIENRVQKIQQLGNEDQYKSILQKISQPNKFIERGNQFRNFSEMSAKKFESKKAYKGYSKTRKISGLYDGYVQRADLY